MTRHVRLVAALAALICASCDREPGPSATDLPGTPVRFFGPGMRDVAQRPGEEFDKPRPAITLGNGGVHKVSNCRDYLLWTSKGGEPVTDYDGTLTTDYLMCAVAAFVPLARGPARSVFVPDAIGEAIYRRLDLRTFRSLLRAEAATGKPYLADRDFTSVSVTQHSVEVETPEWQFAFEALAAGDFDGDGTEDLLLIYTEDTKQAPYYLAMTLLLRRSQPDGDISATVPGLPAGAGQQSPDR